MEMKLKDSDHGKAGVEQADGIGDEQALIRHKEHRDKHPRRWQGTPKNNHNIYNPAKKTVFKREKETDWWEQNHR